MEGDRRIMERKIRISLIILLIYHCSIFCSSNELSMRPKPRIFKPNHLPLFRDLYYNTCCWFHSMRFACNVGCSWLLVLLLIIFFLCFAFRLKSSLPPNIMSLIPPLSRERDATIPLFYRPFRLCSSPSLSLLYPTFFTSISPLLVDRTKEREKDEDFPSPIG